VYLTGLACIIHTKAVIWVTCKCQLRHSSKIVW